MPSYIRNFEFLTRSRTSSLVGLVAEVLNLHNYMYMDAGQESEA